MAMLSATLVATHAMARASPNEKKAAEHAHGQPSKREQLVDLRALNLTALTLAAGGARHCVGDGVQLLNDWRYHEVGCPGPWLEELSNAHPRPSAPVMINVGANKGYSAQEFLAAWSAPERAAALTGKAWGSAIREYAKHVHSKTLRDRYCGNCGDCRRLPPTPQGAVGAHAHLLELVGVNRALLRSLVRVFGLESSVSVHDFAASNLTQNISFEKSGIFPGGERTIATKAAPLPIGGKAMESVRAVALDDFFEARGLSQVYLVSIDTEGHDALVLEGMRRAIRRRAVSLIEFEVNNLGYWHRGARADYRKVRDVAQMLGSSGYHCFWQTHSALVPLTGECWRDKYEMRRWSNVLCAHEARLVDRMYAMAHGLEQKRRALRGLPHS